MFAYPCPNHWLYISSKSYTLSSIELTISFYSYNGTWIPNYMNPPRLLHYSILNNNASNPLPKQRLLILHTLQYLSTHLTIDSKHIGHRMGITNKILAIFPKPVSVCARLVRLAPARVYAARNSVSQLEHGIYQSPWQPHDPKRATSGASHWKGWWLSTLVPVAYPEPATSDSETCLLLMLGIRRGKRELTTTYHLYVAKLTQPSQSR